MASSESRLDTGSVKDGEFSLRCCNYTWKAWHMLFVIVISVALIIGMAIGLPIWLSRSTGGSQADVAIDVVLLQPTPSVTSQHEGDESTAVPTTPPLAPCDERCAITLPSNGSIFRVSAPDATVACFAGNVVTLPTIRWFPWYIRSGDRTTPTTVSFDRAADQPCPDITWYSEDDKKNVAVLRPGPEHCESDADSGRYEWCSIPWRWTCTNDCGDKMEGSEVFVELRNALSFSITYHRQYWYHYREVADPASGGYLYDRMDIFGAYNEDYLKMQNDVNETILMRTVFYAQPWIVHRDTDVEHLIQATFEYAKHNCYGDVKREVNNGSSLVP